MTPPSPWNAQITTSPARCLVIRVGERVTFYGDFAEHPLDTNGGTFPTPLAAAATILQDAGAPLDDAGDTTTITVKFQAPGAYGYHCMQHGNETGTIQVK